MEVFVIITLPIAAIAELPVRRCQLTNYHRNTGSLAFVIDSIFTKPRPAKPILTFVSERRSPDAVSRHSLHPSRAARRAHATASAPAAAPPPRPQLLVLHRRALLGRRRLPGPRRRGKGAVSIRKDLSSSGSGISRGATTTARRCRRAEGEQGRRRFRGEVPASRLGGVALAAQQGARTRRRGGGAAQQAPPHRGGLSVLAHHRRHGHPRPLMLLDCLMSPPRPLMGEWLH
jgi:hypothetical protein